MKKESCSSLFYMLSTVSAILFRQIMIGCPYQYRMIKLKGTEHMMELIYQEKETEMDQNNQLPKHVCQIGKVEGKNSIYIEEYVEVYISEFCEKEETQTFVLLGERREYDQKDIYQVNAAIRICKNELTEICELKKKIAFICHKHFPELDILGFAYADIDSKGIESIDETITQSFCTKYKEMLALYCCKQENICYIYDGLTVKRESGYYRYFSDHSEMKSLIDEQSEQSMIETEDTAVLQFRDIMKEKQMIRKQRSWMAMMSGVNMILLILVLAIGISMINHYESMSRVCMEISQIQAEKEETRDPLSTVYEEKNPAFSTEQVSDNQVKTEVTVPKSYMVKEGDTLNKISRRFYQSQDMVEAICHLNQINDQNLIVCGQEILLP